MAFVSLRGQCLAERRLFEDLDFPAQPSSIQPGGDRPADWVWKRPKDLCPSPKFVVHGTTRFDLVQGEMGDCWFVAAATLLATKPELFAKVVPNNQNFTKEYAGIFHFHLWRFGEWVEVVIDDKLPVTVDGKLRFGHNRTEKDEFWGPLLEKAYAKLHGSYHALDSGHMRDALVDFTGGLSESYMLRREEDVPANLFEIIVKSFQMGSLMGAGIWSDVGCTTEEALWNGLYRGHAYSITAVTECRIQGWAAKLIRLRNPWGRREWNGPWSDGSEEWQSLTEAERTRLHITVADEGEFWMTFDDLVKNFSLLEIVHLGPSSSTPAGQGDTECGHVWHEAAFHGRWVNGVNAGGSGLLSTSKDLYFSNPQYFVTLFTADADSLVGVEECTCIVSLMLKHSRRRSNTPGQRRIVIRFDVHQVRSGEPEFMQDETLLDKTKLKKQIATRAACREVTCRLGLAPATYVIIPHTLKAHEEGEFLLRVYTLSVTQPDVIEESTGPIPVSVENPAPVKPIGNLSSEFFWRYAADDYVIDARELRDLLNELARKELRETTAFCVETCRCLISMFDKNQTGTIDFVQAGNLWDEVLFWRQLFQTFDRDDTGCIETYELRSVFRRTGFSLSFDCLSILAVRYGGKERTLFFEDFVLCLAKAQAMYEVYKTKRKDGTRELRMELEEWMTTTLSS